MGSLKQNSKGVTEVQGDFYLATAGDIVADPSAPNAFVEGIMEGAEWVFNPTLNEWQVVEADKMKTSMQRMSSAEIENKKFDLFEIFLKSLTLK